MDDQTEEEPTQNPAFQSYSSVFSVLGILLSILSLSSIIQRLFTVPLSSMAIEVLAFYRVVADEAKKLIFDWWIGLIWPDWSFPDWAFDVFVIWILFVLSSIRGLKSEVKAVGGKILPGQYISSVLLGPILFLALLSFFLLRAFDERAWVRLVPDRASQIHEAGHVAHAEVLRSVARRNVLFMSAPILGTVLFFVWSGLSL